MRRFWIAWLTFLAVGTLSGPSFADGATRRWLGPDWHANRLQDWRLVDGRIVCDDSRLPVRTAHQLCTRLRANPEKDIHCKFSFATTTSTRRSEC